METSGLCSVECKKQNFSIHDQKLISRPDSTLSFRLSVSPEGTVADAVDELLFGDRGVEQGVNVEVHQAEEVRDGFLKGPSQH